MFSKKRPFLLISIAIAIMLSVVSAVYAAHVTIDTNDGAVDTNWANVPVSINDGADANANYDIFDAWVGNSADNSAFYFRVNLAGTGQLPTDYDALEARLDCNQDGDFADAQDVVVYYINDAFLGEQVVECQGNDYFDCFTADANPVTFGEEIAGPPYNYEWQADTVNGTIDWLACLGTFNVQFASVNGSGAVQDITVWQAYSAPNAVTLSSIGAQSPLMSISAIVLGVMAVGGLIVIRRKTKGG